MGVGTLREVIGLSEGDVGALTSSTGALWVSDGCSDGKCGAL